MLITQTHITNIWFAGEGVCVGNREHCEALVQGKMARHIRLSYKMHKLYNKSHRKVENRV